MTRARAIRTLAATVAVVALALVAVFAASAGAKRIQFGSKLTAVANRSEARGSDTVFWSTDLPGKRRFRVPKKGKILLVRVKGIALRNGKKPNSTFHVQVLHPAHGKVRVKLTSGDFQLPSSGDPQQVNTYYPVNLCVKKRDFVGFNELGGYDPPKYPNGTPFQIFSSSAGAATKLFQGPSGNGAQFKGSRHKGEELLMQVVVGTGKDAAPCPS